MLDQRELLRRLRLDFPKSEAEIQAEIREIKPDFDFAEMPRHIASGELESMVLEGERRYFRRAARNLFRINPELKAYYEANYGDDNEPRHRFLAEYLPNFIQNPEPKTFHFHFQVKLKENTVNKQDLVKFWLPYPAECKYQSLGEKLSQGGLHSGDATHTSLYYEGVGLSEAEAEYTFHSKGFVADKAKPTVEFYQSEHLSEQLPHITFSPDIRRLSAEIVGNERNKMEIARRIFVWISENIAWAAAREYSTIDCIPHYVLQNRHGDCGQKTLLFISLCRINGIPTRWLSGFMLYPKKENLHDWCEIFCEERSMWLPVDASFGIQRWAKSEELMFFYFTNIDPYRLVVNRGISAEFSPPKQFPRSETVDFQRGEVETQQGNLYFDQFSYDFEVKEDKAK